MDTAERMARGVGEPNRSQPLVQLVDDLEKQHVQARFQLYAGDRVLVRGITTVSLTPIDFFSIEINLGLIVATNLDAEIALVHLALKITNGISRAVFAPSVHDPVKINQVSRELQFGPNQLVFVACAEF